MEIVKAIYNSPIGQIEITGNQHGIISLYFIEEAPAGKGVSQDETADGRKSDDRVCSGEMSGGGVTCNEIHENAMPETMKQCMKQLDEYFKGERKDFSVCCTISGTPFQRRVLAALMDIPYGKTISYAQLAERVGNRKAVRAVGGANSRNRLPIIFPCHRVIGSDGKLTGYAGGLWRKKWLLEHEEKRDK